MTARVGVERATDGFVAPGTRGSRRRSCATSGCAARPAGRSRRSSTASRSLTCGAAWPIAPGALPGAADTLSMIFSGTKGLVATCMLLLVERGKLELDAPVGELLAGVRRAAARSDPRAPRALPPGRHARAHDAGQLRGSARRRAHGAAAGGAGADRAARRDRHLPRADVRLAVRRAGAARRRAQRRALPARGDRRAARPRRLDRAAASRKSRASRYSSGPQAAGRSWRRAQTAGRTLRASATRILWSMLDNPPGSLRVGQQPRASGLPRCRVRTASRRRARWRGCTAASRAAGRSTACDCSRRRPPRWPVAASCGGATPTSTSRSRTAAGFHLNPVRRARTARRRVRPLRRRRLGARLLAWAEDRVLVHDEPDGRPRQLPRPTSPARCPARRSGGRMTSTQPMPLNAVVWCDDRDRGLSSTVLISSIPSA